MSCRVARYLEAGRVIAIDLVPERLERARARGIDVLDLNEFDGDADVVTATGGWKRAIDANVLEQRLMRRVDGVGVQMAAGHGHPPGRGARVR